MPGRPIDPGDDRGRARYITPVQGALLQELIDVAVIGNALRALKGRTPTHTVLGG